jgi:hypothetical protein
MIQDFKDLSERLSDLLDKETTYLREKRVSDFSLLQAEKLSLVNFYEKQSAEILALLTSAEEVNSEELEWLRRIVVRINESMTQNAIALKAMTACNNRFIKTLIDTVTKENQQLIRYGRSGNPVSQPQQKEAPGILGRQTQSS